MTSPTHVFSDLDGIRLHHLDYGGEGRPILLIHGVLGQAWMWDGIAPALTELGRVVSLDLRGYGDSQWSNSGAYSTERFADDLIALSARQGWSGAAVVGFSLGGLVGLAAWDQHSALIERLVMIDLPPASEKSETEIPPVSMSVRNHGEALERESLAVPGGRPDLLEVMAYHGWRPGSGGELTRKHDPLFSVHWPFRGEDWWSVLDRFEPPLLFVHASNSLVCSRDIAEDVARRAANGTMVEVERSGHLIPLVQPTELTRLLIDFLSA